MICVLFRSRVCVTDGVALGGIRFDKGSSDLRQLQSMLVVDVADVSAGAHIGLRAVPRVSSRE